MWPAMERWRRAVLMERHGSLTVKVASSREIVRGGGVHGGGGDGAHEMRLRDFIRLQRQDDQYTALQPDDRLQL